MENIFIGAWKDKRGISADDVSLSHNMLQLPILISYFIH